MTNTAKKLLKEFLLPNRPEDIKQITLRVEFDTYAKLHAMKSLFPHKSVNQIINSLLESGLSLLIDELGEPKAESYEYVPEIGKEVMCGSNSAYLFAQSYRQILETGSLPKETEDLPKKTEDLPKEKKLDNKGAEK